jgi:crotonobetainyl-CoA:carnitine CoA-transferase CaiB-like acyl-CoA transferase
MSGIMTMTGNRDRNPSRIGGSLIDIGAATNAVLGVLLAVRHRESTGEGQKVESSLFETAVGWGGEWCTYYTHYGEEPQRMGDKKPTYAPVGAYETDDELVYIAAIGDKTWRNLCTALELKELRSDPRYATAEKRRENRAELDARIEEVTSKYESEVLVDALLAENVPASKINSIPDVVDDPHLRERGMLRECETESGEEVVVPSIPMKLSQLSPLDADEIPDAGEHSRSVLRGIGYSEEEIEELAANGMIDP